MQHIYFLIEDANGDVRWLDVYGFHPIDHAERMKAGVRAAGKRVVAVVRPKPGYWPALWTQRNKPLRRELTAH